MPAYPNVAAFLALVRAANPTYARVKKSSLAPLLAVLNNAAGNAVLVAAEIINLKNVNDAEFGCKAIKYKAALQFLQRNYPVPLPIWVSLGAVRARSAHYAQAAIPVPFNTYGPGMYNANNFIRVQPVCTWAGLAACSVEDFVYTAPGPVGAVLIHIDALQPGMTQMVDGMRVVDHMKLVLQAVLHRGGNACALHIGASPPVCVDLVPDFTAFAARVAVNEPGARHMGAIHAAFNAFVINYPTVVVMGFDSDICVRGNLFGASEFPTGAVVGTASLPPITTQASVVTSRALLVTNGTVNGAEYGVINGW